MSRFEIKDKFLLDGEPFQIISGSIHYFRVVPEYWRDRLEKLKNMGCNTVETYIPWNMHEPKKGEFHFEGMLDFEKFLDIAQELGLYAIVRPSPYICAEWELGGLPSWLFNIDGMELRCKNQPYYDNITDYYKVLFPKLVNHQIDKGGNVILMQIENEYGYYGKDTSYLKFLSDLMRDLGATVPFVTSDGPYGKMFINGQLPGALPTGNFGSHAWTLFHAMKKMMKKNPGPLMCMEFWIGWFDAWGNKEHKGSKLKQNIKDLNYILKHGNVNFYMFHGGTNFGFMNGSNYYGHITPDVTSYDYDAPLSEDGQITPKYEAFKQIIKKYRDFDDVEFTTKITRKTYGEIKAVSRIGLFENLERLSTGIKSENPKNMEALDQSYGYTLYRTEISAGEKNKEISFKDAADRIIAYGGDKKLFTLYDKEIESAKKTLSLADGSTLDLLVENMGRVNFAGKIPYQRKGIKSDVLIGEEAHKNWEMFTIPLDEKQMSEVESLLSDSNLVNFGDKPTFTKFTFNVEEPADTFLDFEGWGKGCAFVNGFNIGRYWEIGPQKRLYIPAPLLKTGENTIIMFETEGKACDFISLKDKPDLGPKK